MKFTIIPLLLTSGCIFASASNQQAWKIPVSTKRLPNGLTVVVSEDHSNPTVGVSVVYRVGFRLEPKNRAGFAHLFEHMMFEGTPDAPKGTFSKVIQGGGGVTNGSTRYDYTNYIESAPVSALEPILWLEADRMKTLGFSEKNLKNQQDVVKEEIRVNVLNKPYGLFFWSDMTALAFNKWENAHDGYGALKDIEGAQLQDVQSFHQQYYGPNNAVLAIAGDITPAKAFELAEKYFSPLPSRATPQTPDTLEGLGKAEKRIQQTDKMAQVPALAFGWRMPERTSKDHAAAVVLTDLLSNGQASRLTQELVKGKQLLLNLNGGINWPLDNAWNYSGPTLCTLFGLYKPGTNPDVVLKTVDENLKQIATQGVSEKELQRVKTRMVSQHYQSLEMFMRRANELALAQALLGRAEAINERPELINAVKMEDIKRVASLYFTPNNRVVIDRVPQPQQQTK